MNNDNLKSLIYWINEREGIRKEREAGKPKPWSTDPIFQNYHFCNVHREDDRGTKELHAVRAEQCPSGGQLPEFYTAARLFNKADTLETYWTGGITEVKNMRDRGETIFHVAYVVSTCGAAMDKVDYVHRIVEEVAAMLVPATSCQAAFDKLRTVHGMGSFLCGQVVADLKYTPYLDEAPDWFDFAVMGPGSKKGLDYIFGGGTTENNFHDKLVYLRNLIKDDIPDIHNQDLQNCLCEFSKYMRLKTNSPGRRRPYNANN